jgi:uncharacterized protein
MGSDDRPRCTAFEGFRCIATGDLVQVALKTKKVMARGERAPVLIFDDATGEQIELDLRGTLEDVRERLAAPVEVAASAGAGEGQEGEGSRGRGRPRLGVVAREVTLLPRHWEWLNDQRGGASVALRKLVEEARLANEGKDRIRRSQDAGYRFMSAIAGNLPRFEEASRALYARDGKRFAEQIRGWPKGIREHLARLLEGSMQVTPSEEQGALRGGN